MSVKFKVWRSLFCSQVYCQCSRRALSLKNLTIWFKFNSLFFICITQKLMRDMHRKKNATHVVDHVTIRLVSWLVCWACICFSFQRFRTTVENWIVKFLTCQFSFISQFFLCTPSTLRHVYNVFITLNLSVLTLFSKKILSSTCRVGG